MTDESILIENLRFCSLKQLAEYLNEYRRDFQSGFHKFKKIRYDEETNELVFDLVVIEENLPVCETLPRYRKVIDINEFVKNLKESKNG